MTTSDSWRSTFSPVDATSCLKRNRLKHMRKPVTAAGAKLDFCDIVPSYEANFTSTTGLPPLVPLGPAQLLPIATTTRPNQNHYAHIHTHPAFFRLKGTVLRTI